MNIQPSDLRNALRVALGVYDILKHGIDARCESKSCSEHGRHVDKEETESLGKIIDKVQEKRRGGRPPSFLDKVLDKAQPSVLTDKLAQKVKDELSNRRSSGSNW